MRQGIGLLMLLFLSSFGFADWPQLLGPQRNGISTEKGLLRALPAGGPPVVWERQVGEGFSGPVVAGGKLILFQRVGDQEVIECLEAATGKGIWKTGYATSYEDQLGKGNGPRSTPTIDGNRVFTLGAEGMLQCTGLDDGKKLWARNIVTDYGVPPSYFGVGTSPLVTDNLVLVNVGSRKAGIVAFSTTDGKEAWQATTDGASYSSPALATIAGRKLAVFFTRNGPVLLEPATGKVVYQARWRARYDASVNAATPLIIDNELFFSTSYETGALLLRVARDKVEQVWSGDDILSNHYNTSIHHQGYLYGLDGRQERGPRLRCIELNSGKVQWTKDSFGCANLLLADGVIHALTEKGDLVLFEASPKEYRELGRARVLVNAPVRAHLALANGLLYGRDERKLVCWKLRGQ